MLHRIIRVILCLAILVLCLTACNQAEIGSGAMGSEVWTEMPALTYGVLESDPLEVLPWNNGRCEATSRNVLAETENGYYMVNYGYLYYADKSNLGNWMAVCNRPDCKHGENDNCDALVLTPGIIIKDGRIFFQTQTGYYPHLNPYKDNKNMLLSMAADGTDKQFAYAIEEAAFTGAGGCMGFLTSQNWLYYVEHLGADGGVVRNLYRTTEAGTKEFPANTNSKFDAYLSFFAYGDEAYYCNVLGTAEYGCLRFVDGELVETECDGLEVDGAYLSGNILRIFRPNDGYYDVDLTTREEIFLAPAQLENSSASIVLPNCVIETTLFDGSLYQDKNREMKLFDGENWHTVGLPKELAESVEAYEIPDFSVTSDGIFFYCWKDRSTHLYRIPLTTGELKAEYCCEIG